MAGMRARRAREQRAAALAAKKAELEDLELTSMKEQLEGFKTNLESFATSHRREINKNAQFRKSFQAMCDVVGVDALASKKGFWSELLGLGDFYYELGILVVETTLATRPHNGGLMELAELHKLVCLRRGTGSDISQEDIVRSIEKLKILGNGFQLHKLNSGQILVQSTPTELSQDHSIILSEASVTSGHISVNYLVQNKGWQKSRAHTILEQLVHNGLAWVDDQCEDRQREYWFPGLAS